MAARWVEHQAGHQMRLPQGVLDCVDRDERRVLLFQSDWELQYTERENPNVKLLAVA